MRPPLTRVELKVISDRNHGEEDVIALLWEIKRLRAVLLRSHDYFRLSPMSSTGQMLADSMRKQLDEEPVVKEQPIL